VGKRVKEVGGKKKGKERDSSEKDLFGSKRPISGKGDFRKTPSR